MEQYNQKPNVNDAPVISLSPIKLIDKELN